jgi:hypothetical protein
MNKIDKLISIIRNLKEEGMSIAPTNNTGSTPEVAGYSANADQKHAGYDKLMPKCKPKRIPTIILRRQPPVF